MRWVWLRRRLLRAVLAGGLGSHGGVHIAPSVSVTSGSPALAALSQLTGLGGLLGGGLPGGVGVGDDTPRQIGKRAMSCCGLCSADRGEGAMHGTR